MLPQLIRSSSHDDDSMGPAQPYRPSSLAPVDKAPPPKPLVMGGTLPPVAPETPVRTRWQQGSMPAFPIEPANDPIQHLADDDSTAMTLLALVLCATLTLTLLGFGLQMWQ